MARTAALSPVLTRFRPHPAAHLHREAVVGQVDAVGQGGGLLGVQHAVGHVDEIRAVGVDSVGRTDGLFERQVLAVGAVAEGVEPFSHFWSRNQEVLDQLVRQSPEYRRLTEGGVAEDSALVKVSQDAGVVDSLKQAYQRLEASFVAIDPANGHIRAWAGGRDFAENKYDHVSQAKRQPGSTFKPFVYAAALDHGFSPEDYVRDEVVTHVDPHTGKRWSPRKRRWSRN